MSRLSVPALARGEGGSVRWNDLWRALEGVRPRGEPHQGQACLHPLLILHSTRIHPLSMLCLAGISEPGLCRCHALLPEICWQVSNMRTTDGKDDLVQLANPRTYGLEEALAYISHDEMLEVRSAF